MASFYKHEISTWMDGTESLSDGEYRAYHVICQLIYLQEGPIVLHESGIAGRCNQHILSFRANLRKLIEKGKLLVASDGRITQTRVVSELKKMGKGSRSGRSESTQIFPQPTPDLPSTSRQPQGGSAEVQRRSSGGLQNKALKNKDPTPQASSLDKTRLDKIYEGSNEPSTDPPADPRTRLFQNGLRKLVLITGRTEDSCRSLIGSLLKIAEDDPIEILAAIDDAERNRIANPYPWIRQVVMSRKKGAPDRKPKKSARDQAFEELFGVPANEPDACRGAVIDGDYSVAASSFVDDPVVFERR